MKTYKVTIQIDDAVLISTECEEDGKYTVGLFEYDTIDPLLPFVKFVQENSTMELPKKVKPVNSGNGQPDRQPC